MTNKNEGEKWFTSEDDRWSFEAKRIENHRKNNEGSRWTAEDDKYYADWLMLRAEKLGGADKLATLSEVRRGAE